MSYDLPEALDGYVDDPSAEIGVNVTLSILFIQIIACAHFVYYLTFGVFLYSGTVPPVSIWIFFL